MNLTDAQKAQVKAWLEQGLKLNEVQKRLEVDFGLRLTYLEVKLVVADLQVLPKDPEPARPAPDLAQAASPHPGVPGKPTPGTGKRLAPEEALPQEAGSVSVTVDQLAQPGTMASGSVTFGDGKTAAWYIDQVGRIGVSPKEKGYRPSAVDMQEFQAALEQELARLGY